MTQETVAEYVGRALAAAGARRCFGVVGSGNFHVTNALVANGVAFVAARHECGAVTMADAYSRLTGELTLASVHPGPGLTNAVTAITEAAKSRTPLIVLAGDSANGALRSNFYIRQGELAESVGAVAQRVHSPRTAVADVARAIAVAVRDRCTVVLNLPLDVQSTPVVPAAPVASPLLGRVEPDQASVAAVAGLLAKAERPVFIAGHGALLAGARDPIIALADHVGALLATSARANGMFAGEAWDVGISGGFASPAAVELIASADLVIGFGASLTQWTTRHGSLVRSAQVVQVDVAPDRIASQRPVDLALVGDATAAADLLLGRLRELMPAPRAGFRTREAAECITAGANNTAPYDDSSGVGHIDPRTLTIALDGILPTERTLVLDSGHFMAWPARHLRVPDAGGWVFTQAFQSIGLGLASGIGAAIARPDRLTVVAAGDGGFLMGVADLETAVRLGLDLFVLVYNDAAYSAEVHHFGPHGHPVATVTFPDVDIAAIARGFGAESAIVRSLDDLGPVRDWVARGSHGIMLVDAKVTPDLVGEWLEEAFNGEH